MLSLDTDNYPPRSLFLFEKGGFIDGLPTYVAAFYQDNLKIEDWGEIVQPKEGGGRTTSVSIMGKSGIKKMCNNWVAVLDDEAYIELFAKPKWIGYRVDNGIQTCY